MNFNSTKFKIIIISILCLAVGSMAVIHLIGAAHNKNMKLVSEEAVRMSKEMFYNSEINNTRVLSAEIQFLAENSTLKKHFIEGDREKLYDIALPLFNKFKERYGINYWSFINPGSQGEYLLRVHEPEKFGDAAGRATYEKAIRTNQLSFGRELTENLFILWVVSPYYHKGKLIGFMELGEETGRFLELMKKQTGYEYWLLIDKGYMDKNKWAAMRASRGLESNWNDLRDVVILSSTRGTEMISFEETISEIPNGGIVFAELRKDGRTFVRGAFPVYDVNSRKVGVIYVLHEVTKMYDELKSLQSRVVIYMTVLAFILSSLIIVILNRESKTEAA